MKTLKFISVLLVTLSLTACHQRPTYRDLFLNHDLRTKLYDECQMGDEAKKQSHECEMVFNVMSNFNSTYNEAVTDGEYLGQQVLNMQIELKNLQRDLLLKKQALETLKKNKANEADIQKASDELKTMQKTCHQKKDEINFTIAVIGLAESPE